MKLSKHVAAFAGVALVAGAVAFAGPALASPKVGSGTVKCHIAGTLKFNPPLKNGGTASTTITLATTLKNCTGTGDGATITGGTASGATTAPTNDCASLAGTHAYILKTKALWTVLSGKPALAPSTVKFTKEIGQTGPPVAFDATGKVTAGSFVNDLASAHAVIKEDLATIASECSGTGVSVLHIVASTSTSSLHH